MIASNEVSHERHQKRKSAGKARGTMASLAVDRADGRMRNGW